mmetsp:Transcript_41838/g.139130  ORF Transcript_41838/g.139130 Transcript_41838/m.139130 type:complete len:279 (-) Transcript_41838:1149-1985(-)
MQRPGAGQGPAARSHPRDRRLRPRLRLCARDVLQRLPMPLARLSAAAAPAAHLAAATSAAARGPGRCAAASSSASSATGPAGSPSRAARVRRPGGDPQAAARHRRGELRLRKDLQPVPEDLRRGGRGVPRDLRLLRRPARLPAPAAEAPLPSSRGDLRGPPRAAHRVRLRRRPRGLWGGRGQRSLRDHLRPLPDGLLRDMLVRASLAAARPSAGAACPPSVAVMAPGHGGRAEPTQRPLRGRRRGAPRRASRDGAAAARARLERGHQRAGLRAARVRG